MDKDDNVVYLVNQKDIEAEVNANYIHPKSPQLRKVIADLLKTLTSFSEDRVEHELSKISERDLYDIEIDLKTWLMTAVVTSND